MKKTKKQKFKEFLNGMQIHNQKKEKTNNQKVNDWEKERSWKDWNDNN